jgi:hypothetical protein
VGHGGGLRRCKNTKTIQSVTKITPEHCTICSGSFMHSQITHLRNISRPIFNIFLFKCSSDDCQFLLNNGPLICHSLLRTNCADQIPQPHVRGHLGG